MSYEILTKSYGRRLPKITATATSTDDLATLGTDYAEGSTCVINDTTYKLDKVQGWVDPSSQPSGGGGCIMATYTYDETTEKWSCDKTFAELMSAYEDGSFIVAKNEWTGNVDYLYMAYEEDGAGQIQYKLVLLDEGDGSLTVQIESLNHSYSTEDGEEIAFTATSGAVSGFTPSE